VAKEDITYRALSLGLRDALDIDNFKYFLISLVLALVSLTILIIALSGLIQQGMVLVDLGDGWLGWISVFIANILLATLGYFLIVPLMFLVMSIFTGRVAENIRVKHYGHISFDAGVGPIEALFETLVVILKFILYFLIASPALLLFGAGQLVYVGIGFVLFRKLLLLETLGTHLPLSIVKERSQTFNGGKHFSASIVLYVASLIPVINLFVPYLSICILLNESMIQEVDDLT